MLIDKSSLTAMFRAVARRWRDQGPVLGEIDARFGDGDHGVTMGKIAGLLEAGTAAWGGESVREFLETLGQSIMAVGGGSAGPLYGALVGGLAEPLADEAELNGQLWKDMLAAARDGLCDLTKARAGDKTMMDALIPAVEAALAAGDDLMDIVSASARAADQGARETEKYTAKFGRARHYGDKSIGTPDAGALSTALFFQGLEAGLRESK